MSILLYVIGAITLVFGALAIGFGIPVNEFSFGNTLIMAGTTGAVGGLIVMSLGAVVAHLQRLADVIAMRAPLRPNRPPEAFEPGRAPATGRMPFPPKPKAEPAATSEPLAPAEPPLTAAAAASGAVAAVAAAVAAPAEEPAAETEAPTLPNPEVAPMAEEPSAHAFEEAPPPPPFATEPPLFAAEPLVAAVSEPEPEPVAPLMSELTSRLNGAGAEELVSEPPPEPASTWEPAPPPEPPPAWEPAPPPPAPEPLRPSEEADFEALWPAPERHPLGPSAPEEAEPVAGAAPAVEPETPAPASERRNVEVLKSGVVDGMAYTLYVDGSIEAELPQGTLHFASINDLREHLEKTS